MQIYIKAVLRDYAEDIASGVENALLTEDGLFYLTTEDGLYYIAY